MRKGITAIIAVFVLLAVSIGISATFIQNRYNEVDLSDGTVSDGSAAQQTQPAQTQSTQSAELLQSTGSVQFEGLSFEKALTGAGISASELSGIVSDRGVMRPATLEDYEIVNKFLLQQPDIDSNNYEHWGKLMAEDRLYMIYIVDGEVRGVQRADPRDDGTLYLTMFYMLPEDMENHLYLAMEAALYDWIISQPYSETNKVEFQCTGNYPIYAQTLLFPDSKTENPLKISYDYIREREGTDIRYVLIREPETPEEDGGRIMLSSPGELAKLSELAEAEECGLMNNEFFNGAIGDDDFESCVPHEEAV